MALSPKTIPFVFLLTFFFMQIYARDSQFFSKVSPTTTVNPSTTNNGKEEENLNKQEQYPTFMPETQNGYGLYGQETTQTQFPTTTKLGNAPYTTATAYKTQNQDTNDNYNNNEYDNTNQYYSNNNAYDQKQQQNFGLEESSYTNPNPNPNSNNKYNYNGYSNSERQGMSDTRFLENGRFYHDIKSENNYFPYHYQNSRTNNYDTAAYYNTNTNHNNNVNENENENTYQYNNSMENFHNQDDQYVP